MIDQIFTKLNNNKVKYLILSDYKYNNIIIDNYKENFNKFLNFIREFELRLKNEFKYNYNLYIRLDFQNENYNNCDISCKYTFYEPINHKALTFNEDNILINGTNSNSNGFEFMIFEINNECYKNIKYQNINEIILKKQINAKFILELGNGFYLGWGKEKDINIYDENLSILKKIKRFKNYKYQILNILEIYYEKYKEENYIIISSNANFNLFKIKFKTFDYFHIHIEDYYLYHISYFNIEKNNHLFTSKNGSTWSIGEYQNSLKINNEITILTSNSLIKEKKEKLIYYNTKKKEKINQIEGYSFSPTLNGLSLIKNVIICICTKFYQHQKNGLLIIPLLNNNQKMKEKFYETDNFEPHCIYPLLLIDNKSKVIINKEDIIKKETDFFLVGGLDLEKITGKIKLYKLIYDDIASDYRIEFIEDIELKDNEGIIEIESTVNCIIQSTKDGNILFICSNGDLYIFPTPNLYN